MLEERIDNAGEMTRHAEDHAAFSTLCLLLFHKVDR